MEGSGEKLFSEYPLDSQRGSGAVAGGGTSFFLSRSIAFTRVASRTPGEGSFLGRKQLGQRKAANLPRGNHEPAEAAPEPDSEAGKPRVDAGREVHSRLLGDAQVPGCLLDKSLSLSPGRWIYLLLSFLPSTLPPSQEGIFKAHLLLSHHFKGPAPALQSVP